MEYIVRIGNGGTPHNDAVMPSMFETNVPNVFSLTCARSMYELFNRLKFGRFASHYDQIRAGARSAAEFLRIRLSCSCCGGLAHAPDIRDLFMR